MADLYHSAAVVLGGMVALSVRRRTCDL